MATLVQVLKRLQAQRRRTQDGLRTLDEVIAGLEKLIGTDAVRRGQEQRWRGRKLISAARKETSQVQKARSARTKGLTGFAADRGRRLSRRKGKLRANRS